jgi:acetyl-CoA acetyltransferase
MSASDFAGKFAIVGTGIVSGPFPEGLTLRSAEAEAARLAIEDAGLRRDQIDGAIQLRGNGGRGEHASHSDAFPRMLGLPFKFYYSIGRGGAVGGLAIATALSFLDMGIANYVVLSGGSDGFSRSRETKKLGYKGTEVIEREGYWGGPFGDLRAPSHHSFFASRHMAEYGTTSEQLGWIAVQERAWAQMNPRAKMYGRSITIEDHQNSPLVVEPYHLLDICLVSDGAVSYVVTTAERARDLRKLPVYILGFGTGEAGGDLWWEKANYTQLAVQPAKEAAFSMAGITLDDIDVAQLYDCFTAEVLFQLEDYGWADKGNGGPFVAAGNIGPGGKIPVNTSGGLLSAYHISDNTGIHEAILQLRGEAGPRQVPHARIAMCTGHGGELISPAMCSIHTSLLLGC